MLLEISVSNFRSFRERQTFSMTAVPRLHKKNNVFPAPVTGEKLPDLLKVAVMYGPNASGKSNFIQALDLVTRVAIRSADAPYNLPVASFRFDPVLADQPSVFEIHFLVKGCRYEFLLALTKERVVRERLTAYPRGNESVLYDRQHIEGTDVYEMSGLEGGEAVHDAWKKLTPPRMLFISQAVASSSEELMQLRAPHRWLTRGIFSFEPKEISTIAERSLQLARDSDHQGRLRSAIAAFLSDVDVPVTNLRIARPESMSMREIAREGVSASLGLSDAVRPPPQARKAAVFTHKSALGEAEFGFDEESEGTQNLVGLWLPWLTRGASEDYDRYVLAIDELDSSLHPAIVANLVKKHLEAAVPSQLIFTTHDTHLMDSKLLRRDQFWISERNMNGATELRSIHDFEGREGEDIEKRYYEGRYRGLPLVRA
ncbi:ATP/GTP-binding protein [Burkholderiaceae bacterium UC74_6]